MMGWFLHYWILPFLFLFFKIKNKKNAFIIVQSTICHYVKKKSLNKPFLNFS
jgi:hypothetical protein